MQSPRHSFSGDGFVLLQNGNVLSGKIATNAERIIVKMDGNSKLNLEHKNVEHIGSSLQALYDHQKLGIRVWGTGEHWHLAHWCIKQGLLDQAIEHYRAIELTAADSPQFRQVEHMLREALLANEQVRKTLGLELTGKNEADVALGFPPDQGNEVVQASANIPKLIETPGDRSRENQTRNGTWKQTEIPGYIRKTFQTSILPVLVTRCGQSGCHGILGKSDFHIYQPIGDQAAITLAKDLDQVLQYIDRDRSNESELLAYATKAHGIQRHPSLNPSREDERLLIERISQWIRSLALTQSIDKTMPQQYPATVAGAKSYSANAVSQAVATGPSVSAESSVDQDEKLSRNGFSTMFQKRDRNASLSKPAKSAPPPAVLSGSELEDLEKAIRNLEEKYENSDSGTPSQSQDPFDPDVFNRKFR